MKHLALSHTLIATLIVALIVLGAPARASAAEPISDDTLQQLIQSRLANHELGGMVAVEVTGGVVTLTGSVDSLAQKREAGKLAYKVDEVTRVENRLTVGTERAPQQLANEVRDVLDTYFLHGVFDWVTADVAASGHVTLKGSVYEPWHRDEIVERVERIAGVREVDNEIEIQSLGADDLRRQVFRAIYGDPTFREYLGLGRLPIHIVVEGNDVSLYGTVRSEVERRKAEFQVRGDTWAHGVDNQLRVVSEIPR